MLLTAFRKKKSGHILGDDFEVRNEWYDISIPTFNHLLGPSIHQGLWCDDNDTISPYPTSNPF